MRGSSSVSGRHELELYFRYVPIADVRLKRIGEEIDHFAPGDPVSDRVVPPRIEMQKSGPRGNSKRFPLATWQG